jgi:hypothetical protein
MMLEDKVERLKGKVEMMTQCYFKGFGALNTSVASAAELYVRNVYGEEKAKKASEALGFLEKMTAFYETIPFQKLPPDEDYALLFVARDLLRMYDRDVRNCFTKPDEFIYNKVWRESQSIGIIGELFRDKFGAALTELRAVPGYETFTVQLRNHDGNLWDNGRGMTI